ncbi:MAG: hypothetical protein ACKOCQ_05280 [Candidatus Nitrosotenuis sp.]
MKLLLFVTIGLILISSGILSADAKIDTKYDTLKNKFEGVPTFCTNEPPQGTGIPESLVPYLMKRTKSNVDAWIGPLKSISMRSANWDVNYIEISRDKQANFDYTKCNVVITFLKSAPEGASGVEVLGREYFRDGKSNVEIYYQGYGVCETKDSAWTYWYTCKQDSPKLVVAMEAILRHELGHAMGLGHYISEELFLTGGLGHPSSIMVPVLDLLASPTHVPLDPELMEIMPVDLAKLKEIYGDNGWGNQVQKTTPVKSEKLTAKTIHAKHTQMITEKITGTIPSSLYKKGIKVDISVLGPDGKTQNQQVATNKAKFEYSFRVSDNTIPGKYEITISYLGKSLKKFVYEVI